MWLNCTRTSVDPAQVKQVVAILEGEASLAPLRSAPGFLGLYLVESTEAPGDLISITVWESAGEGQAYLASPQCRQVVESIEKHLLAPLERSYYTVHLEAGKEPENRIRVIG